MDRSLDAVIECMKGPVLTNTAQSFEKFQQGREQEFQFEQKLTIPELPVG